MKTSQTSWNILTYRFKKLRKAQTGEIQRNYAQAYDNSTAKNEIQRKTTRYINNALHIKEK